MSTRNAKLATASSKKLLPRWIGPFTVTAKVQETVYKLDLQARLKWHNVFHVSLLRPYVDGGRVGRPPLLLIEGKSEYVVEPILADRNVGRGKITKREYLVKWEGYSDEHDSWEPLKHLTNCEEAIQEYWTEKEAMSTDSQGPQREGAGLLRVR